MIQKIIIIIIIIIIISFFVSFSYQRKLVGLLWYLSDSKSPQVSRTLLSIQAEFNNDVVCKVLILPLISSSFRLFQTLRTVPKMPTITVYRPIGKWVECLPMIRETGVQSQVESYQKHFFKW